MKFKIEKLCRTPVTYREKPDTYVPGRYDRLLGIMQDQRYYTITALAEAMEISNQGVSNLISQLQVRHVFEWRYVGGRRAYRWVQERNYDRRI